MVLGQAYGSSQTKSSWNLFPKEPAKDISFCIPFRRGTRVGSGMLGRQNIREVAVGIVVKEVTLDREAVKPSTFQ